LFIRLSHRQRLRAAHGFKHFIKYGVFGAKNYSSRELSSVARESFASKPLPSRRAAPALGR
jgi:hypothetical protein